MEVSESQDVISHLGQLTREESFTLNRRSYIFPWINFERESEMRKAFLEDSNFLKWLDLANSYFRTPLRERKDSISQYLTGLGCQDADLFLKQRENFLETFF